MTRIGHLFDASTGWEQRVGVSQLIDRLPRDRFSHVLASLGSCDAPARDLWAHRMEVLPELRWVGPLSSPVVARFVARSGIDLIHAWGVRAGAAARALPRLPLVIQLYDPLGAATDVKRLRALARPHGFAVVCSAQIVRRRLIEGGLPADLAVVIRPGVDFSLINRWRGGMLRKKLGVGGNELLTIVPQPVTRSGGQFEAVYAVVLRNHLASDVRVLVPGVSREQRRLARFAAALPIANPLITPGDRYPFEQLVSVSDVLLATPRGDLSTTSVAWAMAASTAVVGTAVHSVAEIVAHKVNGLLFKQVPGRSMSAAILARLQDRVSQEKAKEVARGQAYEVFGLRRYIEQTARLYENALSGTSPGEGITDSALDS